MAYIPVSESPSAFVFGTGSILLDFNGTYLQLDGGNEDVSFVRHIRKLGGVIVSAPTIGGLSSALQHNLSAAVPIIGVMPTVKSGGEPDSLKDVVHRLAAKTAEHGLSTTVAKFTPKFEPILLNMTLASGRIELFVLDGGKKESIEALERAVNSGDEAAVAKAAEAHGLILVVVWFAAKQSEPIKRILYTGNASPSRVIAALEKAESLALLCVKTATPAQTAKGIALPARVKVRPSLGSASRPPTAASTTRTATATRPAPTAARTGTGRPPVAKPTPTTSRPSIGSRPAAPATRPAAPPRTAAPSGRLGSASSTSSGPRTAATSRGGATASTKPKEAPAQRKTVGTSQGAALSRAGASTQRTSASLAKPQRGAVAPTTPRAAKTAPAKAPAPASQAPPNVVPPVVVLDEVLDAAGTPAVDVVVIPPTPEPPVAEPRADQQEPAAPEPQPVHEEPAAPETTPQDAVPTEPEAPAAPQDDASWADGGNDSVIHVADVPAPVPSQTADDSIVHIADVPAPVPLVIPDIPAAEAVAPFEPQPVAEPAPAEPTEPTDSSGEGTTMSTVAPGFKEPIAPQPVGASGLLDEVEEPPRLMKISMDTDELEKALKAVDLNEGNETGAGSSSQVGAVESETTMPTLQAESAAETARKISENLIAEAATPFTSALASTIGNSGEAPTAVDQLIDMVSDVTGPVLEAAQAVAADSNKQHPTMQTRSSLVANDEGGERPMEFEQTDPAIDTVLDAVAAASEEQDRSMDNGLDTQNGPAKENEKEDDCEWTEVRPFESTNGPMFVPVSRTAAKPRLTRERYFELVTVPHKAGKCTLESLEEATDFFAAVRSGCYILASEDVAAFVLDGWLAGRKLWNSAGELSSCLVPTVHHPNLTAFTAANGAELDELRLSVRTAIPNSVMTINTEDGPEDYHLSKITL